MRSAVFVSCACLLIATNASAQEQATRSFSFAQLSAFYGDESGNFVDFFVQDFRTASGVPSFFIQIFGSGPDIGDLGCFGLTLAGNVTEDPVDVVPSTVKGNAEFETDNLVDFFGSPCRSGIRVVAKCVSSVDATQFHDTCSFLERFAGDRFRSHHSSFSRQADCQVSVQIDGVTFSLDGTNNGALQAGHSQAQP